VRRLGRGLRDAGQALQLLTDTGEDGSYSSALAMLRAGVDPQREPHLRHMLLAIRSLPLPGPAPFPCPRPLRAGALWLVNSVTL